MELLQKLGEVQSRCGCLPRNELASLAAESGKPLGEVLSVPTISKSDTPAGSPARC